MRIVSTGLAIATCLALLPVCLKADPTLFGNKVTIGTVADLKLTRPQYRAFKWYNANKSYFGAFYIVPETDDVFWTRSFHSLNTAKEAAKQGCQIAYATKSCRLYAVVFPNGVDPNGDDVSGLSQPAAKNFLRKYPKEQKLGKFGAFAINRAFGWGVSYGWETAKEANAAALAFCNSSSSQALAPLPIEGRSWAKKNGLEQCHLIDTHIPAD